MKEAIPDFFFGKITLISLWVFKRLYLSVSFLSWSWRPLISFHFNLKLKYAVVQAKEKLNLRALLCIGGVIFVVEKSSVQSYASGKKN